MDTAISVFVGLVVFFGIALLWSFVIGPLLVAPYLGMSLYYLLSILVGSVAGMLAVIVGVATWDRL